MYNSLKSFYEALIEGSMKIWLILLSKAPLGPCQRPMKKLFYENN